MTKKTDIDTIKKTIRITPEMDSYIKGLSTKLQMSENDTIKLIIYLAQIKEY